METNDEIGTEMSLDDVADEIDRVRREMKENSRYITLDPDSAEEVELTGVIRSRHSSGTDQATGKTWERDVYDFETTETTPQGEARIISFGKTNKIVPQLVAAIRSGHRKLTISRQGANQSTRYSIIEVKKRPGKASTLQG